MHSSSVIDLSHSDGPIDIQCPELPLAVYREVSAHLRQCSGIMAQVLPQSSSSFDYRQSQAGGLRISCAADTDPVERQQVKAILQYYGSRYGDWEPAEGDLGS